MLQAMDEQVLKKTLPACFVFNQCRIRIRMDIGY